ncbi:transglycosylase SLT domain-containing protein [Microvirga pudoricolor]|uniref:transglycosylase SLT domain-containing protein n=1 Tax=Microvirga pudoricolor TaxID=2778729 RepID=UPI0019526C35|nr:transglycosylase SLT domain-containing protein [Microvirga pudoricolor]MBM6592975.1 transglycosylase SLT domain-containing protein [Microvirga pudoricolor]
MTVDSTASLDACLSPAESSQTDDIVWLQPQGSREPAPKKVCFRRLTKTLGIGACLTVASATTATAPAATPQAEPIVVAPVKPPEPRIALPIPAGIDLSDVITPRQQIRVNAAVAPAPILVAEAQDDAIRTASLPAPAAGLQAAPVAPAPDPIPDPLAAFEPEAPVEIEDLQAQIILSGREMSPDGRSEISVEAERAAFESINWIQFDGRRVPRWIVDTILRASTATGVDPVYMMALADKESSFVVDVKAGTSSAVGLFQFLSSTWLDIVHEFGAQHGLTTEADAIKIDAAGGYTVEDETMRDHILGLRKNPYLSALMAAEMMKRDRAIIESRVGRKISRSEFYFAHFFGVNSASKFIQLVDGKPKQSAPNTFPAAAKANRSLFFVKAGKKTRQLSVAEVYEKIDGMIDKRLGRYEDVTSVVVVDADVQL